MKLHLNLRPHLRQCYLVPCRLKNMTHPRALEAMKGYLTQGLKNCQIEKGSPVYETYGEAISRFSDEVLKTKKQWLNYVNVYLIFLNNIYDALRERYQKEWEVTGPLPDLLSNDEVDKIAERILGLIESIPRSYLIYIPLTGATDLGAKKISITQDISLIETLDKDKIPGTHQSYKLENLLGVSKKVEIDKPYLCIVSTGYAGTSIDDSAFQWGKMTLVDTKVELKYKRRRCQNGKDSKSDLHERASRRSSEAHNRRWIKDTGGGA